MASKRNFKYLVENLEDGCLLTYLKSGESFIVENVCKRRLEFTFRNSKNSLRATSILALSRVFSGYNLIKNGDTLKKDIVFYCPKKERIVILEKGSIYLGEL